MNYLLIGVIAFFVIVTLNGWRKGLVRGVFLCSSTILALFISSQCYQVIGKGINEYTTWGNDIKTVIEKNLELGGKENQKLKRGEQTKKIEQLNLPEGIKKGLLENNNKDIYQALQATGFYDYIASYLAKMAINGISFLLTFIISGILIRLLLKVLDFITEIPILKELNTIGGILLGAVEGLIGIWIFFLIVTIFGSTPFGETMYSYINDSVLLSYLYNNNILLLFLTNISKLLF